VRQSQGGPDSNNAQLRVLDGIKINNLCVCVCVFCLVIFVIGFQFFIGFWILDFWIFPNNNNIHFVIIFHIAPKCSQSDPKFRTSANSLSPPPKGSINRVSFFFLMVLPNLMNFFNNKILQALISIGLFFNSKFRAQPTTL